MFDLNVAIKQINQNHQTKPKIEFYMFIFIQLFSEMKIHSTENIKIHSFCK